jgi:hypothetical protein
MSFLASENILIDPVHDKLILPTNENDKEGDVVEDQDEDDWDYYPTEVPSICPKMPALSRLTPPDLSWVAALKDFDANTTTHTLDNDTSLTLKEALRLDKNYLKLNEKYI